MSPRISLTNLYVRCESDKPEPGGHEIFVDHLSIAFIPNVPGVGWVDQLREPLAFLGFGPEQAGSETFQQSLVDESLEASQSEIDAVTPTWSWEHRLASGELEKYRGVVA